MVDEYFEKFRSFRPSQFSTPPEQKYQCEKCQDTGWIECFDEQGNSYAKRCDCWAIREARRMLLQSGISEEFQNKRFKSFDTRGDKRLENAKNSAMRYVKAFSETERTRYNSIIFCGQVGAGKTHLGIAICNHLMKDGIAVAYMPYRNAITKIKQRITDEDNYDRELDKYIKARVLYIDDLLKGKITESDTNIMYEIVNYRYMNNLPLIISSELTTEGLLDFDEAIGSRIIEMCRGNIIQLTGRDLNYRLR